MEYGNYRVKSPVKSFRDLEVYQKTIELSEEITSLPFLKGMERDAQEIKSAAESIPRLIAESYGDKFDSRELAHRKLTESVTLITDMITKIDLFRQKFANDRESKEALDRLLTRYQTQKMKVLNLRKAWQRIGNAGNFGGRK
ncbi:MAG: four helix bundle protein [Candidatus Aenigmarchaeota archaeon]|nr:four helix bundle protein [Candidatus Aenigmarchaeota archaeon]MDI6722557.1 four helix bundle protein [Candidatus Aenigmarchaeota archaeon]